MELQDRDIRALRHAPKHLRQVITYVKGEGPFTRKIMSESRLLQHLRDHVRVVERILARDRGDGDAGSGNAPIYDQSGPWDGDKEEFPEEGPAHFDDVALMMEKATGFPATSCYKLLEWINTLR